MLAPLKHLTYRRLLMAQIVSLLGTGLATVALGLLAYQLAGEDAGAVLGTALAIKMIAYVGVAPFVGAYAGNLPRRTVLVALDVLRAGIVLVLPFVTEVWQVYVLIFLLQAASAAFTPIFQATIPDILPDEDEYTKALSLSRLAYDLESLASPVLAASLLTLMNFHWLFAGTAIGFAASALLVLSIALPMAAPQSGSGGILEQATRGIRNYLATPRLRGLLAVSMTVAAAGALVIVNTVVFVRSMLGGDDADVAIALAVFGAGSMAAALLLPRVLGQLTDRTVMLAASALLSAGLLVTAVLVLSGNLDWPKFLAIWFVLGLAFSAALTPSGRLLRRSSTEASRPAAFAAHFAMSHACWLVTYPLAGWLGATAGLGLTALFLFILAALGAAAAIVLWPSPDLEVIEHIHKDLPANHPHLTDAEHTKHGYSHAHRFVIDELHPDWPRAF